MERSGVMDEQEWPAGRSRVNEQRGVTVIELAMTLSLLGILGSIAFLQIRPLLAQARLNSGARQVATDLQVARMKAIAQNRRFRVTFRTATRDYVVDREDDSSWSRLLLHSHTTEHVDDAVISLPPGVAIAFVNSGGDVIFVPRGHVDGGISITLNSLTGAGTRRVIVNLAGRVRIE